MSMSRYLLQDVKLYARGKRNGIYHNYKNPRLTDTTFYTVLRTVGYRNIFRFYPTSAFLCDSNVSLALTNTNEICFIRNNIIGDERVMSIYLYYT